MAGGRWREGLDRVYTVIYTDSSGCCMAILICQYSLNRMEKLPG